MAMSLVELACEKASGLGDVRVEALHLRLGALSGVVKEALLFSFDVAAEGTPVAGARLEIKDVPLTVRCPRCAVERELPGFPLVCPVCATPTPEILRGKDLELHALEVEENAATHRSGPRGDPQEERPRRARAARPLREGGPRRREPRVESGAGKTALLEATLGALKTRRRVAALVGDLATDNDARRLGRAGVPVRQIVTGTVCHLEAQMVGQALEGWDLAQLDLLFVENVGNLVCPASYDLGERLRVVLMSVTEGEDKPLKYPTIFNSADLAVITKADLAEATGFDREEAYRSIESVRPGLEILETSARTGQGHGPLARPAGGAGRACLAGSGVMRLLSAVATACLLFPAVAGAHDTWILARPSASGYAPRSAST